MHRLVPHFILENYSIGHYNGSKKAAGLFVDLSGFSRMADTLSHYEQPGAEALAEVMRSVFEPLVDAVYRQGGFVVGYAGDAFTAIFIEEQERGAAALRCLAAALDMQANLGANPEASTPFGNYPISFKIGIGLGEASWQILQSASGRRATYYVRGSSVDRAIVAEEAAQPGDIIAEGAAYRYLQDFADWEPVKECYRFSRVLVEMPAPCSFLNPQPDSATLQVFFPDSIINLPTTGEFRQVVNLFIDVLVDLSNDLFVAPFIECVFELQERYGGFFLRPEFGDKGFNLLMFWGAPVAHETDVDRALNFILELASSCKLPVRAGVTYLTAYAGFMGVPLREDYTAYGWGVNLAARFMKMASANEFWLDEEVARRAVKHFSVKYRDKFSVKGFTSKQKVFTLDGRKELAEIVYHGDLIGRVKELEHLSSFIKPIYNGEFAGSLVIRGEAGIGKSRLIHAFQASPVFRENPTQWAICQTDEILRQSLNPLKNWLFKRFNFSDSRSDQENLQDFEAQIDALIDATPNLELADELRRTSSVLAAMLGIYRPGSLYEQLDAKERYENTFIALSTLLRADSLQKPFILFVEDVQWLDSDTRAFIPYFVRTVLADPGKKYPVAILATQRPGGEPLNFGEGLPLDAIELDRLSTYDLLTLAENLLDGSTSASLVSLLERRTDGNPFFAEQILRYLAEKKLLYKNAEGKFDVDTRAERFLPLDISAILVARLDSLTQQVREVVQTASVLGREFEVQLLAGMLRGDMDLMGKISLAASADIWFPLGEIHYIFRHALLRDAAYSMQLLMRQRELHALAVSAMEALYAGELNQHYGELAYHAERGALLEKALAYLPLAGKNAADMYQNRQAVDYYSRCLALIPAEDLGAQFDLIMARAKLYGLMGERTKQLQDLEMLDSLSRQIGDRSLVARVWMMRADYAVTVSDFHYSIEKAKQALELSKTGNAEDVTLDAYRVIPLALLRLGRLDEAMQYAREGLELVKKTGKRIEEGKILNSMGLIALEQREPLSARAFFEEALLIARETSNRGLETKSLNNLGISTGFIQGDYATARKYYEQSFRIAQERGDRSLRGAALGNLGWAAGMQGDFGSAQSYHEQALASCREVGDLYAESYTLINLSAIAVLRNEAEKALAYARLANHLTRKIGERSGEAWSWLYLGYAHLLAGGFADARSAFQETIRIRIELAQPNLVPEALAGLVQVALQTKEIDVAREEAEKILAYLDGGGTFDGSEEPLRIYLACYQVLDLHKDPRSIKVLQDAVKLLEAQLANQSDEKARRMYVENVPWRRAIMEAWQIKQAR